MGDWNTVAVELVGTSSPSGSQFDTIRNTLKLPFAGSRGWNTGNYFSQSTYGCYWSSSPYTTLSSNVSFTPSGGNYVANNQRAAGFSVRCVRN